MSDNPYDILNIPRNSSEEEIKRAYKKLARENHPDKGGSKEKFQEINRAYEMLGNKGNNQQDIFNMFNMFNQFTNITRNNESKKLSNIYYNYNISLRDVYFGLEKKFKITVNINCNKCNIKCSQCDGLGKRTQYIKSGPFITNNTITCNKCSGIGKEYIKSDCKECNDGKINIDKVVNISIPVNVENGKQYIFSEWGEQAIRECDKSGDFIIVIMIDNDINFNRKGNDLYYSLNITLKESIIGKCITIPHFKEEFKLDLSGFGIINPNKRYTVYDKGMPGGNLHILFNIEYPDRSLTKEEITEYKEVLKF